MNDDLLFDRVWGLCADAGFCDAAGGAEYIRVRDEWRAREGPVVDLVNFIRVRANAWPSIDGQA